MANKPKGVVAGNGSVVDVNRPVYRNASSYDPAENVNQGPGTGGGRKSITPGHGQNSDGSGEKDQLVTWSETQKDPYRAKASEFPVKNVKAATGQSGEYGTAEGQDMLVDYSDNQMYPRTAEDGGLGDSGAGMPVPGDRSAVVARNFSITQNRGESDMPTGQMPIGEYIDLQTGRICADGFTTPVAEVPEKKLTIGRR